ncbi:MAG TPA: glycosyltransferase family 4 protein [Gammaproteobacteria bacterium]|nr:glycosyltransferase family 4 protein [Gammaproteobacteria bacterium]
MRIALLALNFAEYASRLAVALATKHEVLLVLRASNAERELTDELRTLVEESVTVRHLEPRRRRDPRVLGTSFSINRIVRDFAPDVLHIHEEHPVLAGWTVVSLRKTIPLVFTVHDPVSHAGGPPKDGLRWKILMWFRRRANRLIVHGPRMLAEIEALDGRLAGRVDVVPHGILGRAAVDGNPSGNEQGTLLFFGRMEPYKGLRYFLDAGDILRSRGHEFRLIVAGTGTDLTRHRERIAASDWVELIDRYVSATEVADLFRRSAAVVLPYTDATQSGVAAIAFANSRPVIASAVGDLPDVVIPGRTGLLVAPCDARALADAMEKILVDRALRDSLAAGAGQYARERLSWPRIAELTQETYRRAIESRSDPVRWPANQRRGTGSY